MEWKIYIYIQITMKIDNFYQNRYETNIFWSSISDWQKFTFKDVSRESLSGKKIMEIWVGPNWLIFQIIKKKIDCELIGVDLDTHVLNYLKKIWITWFDVDISNSDLPVKDWSVDIIIFNEVIEHVFDCQHALNEIYRVLKKWWKLYVSTHNSFNLFMRIKFLLGKIPAPSLDVSYETMWEHIRLFNKNLLQKLLLRAWFKKANIINRSRFKLGTLSFYTKKLTSLWAIHLYFIATK